VTEVKVKLITDLKCKECGGLLEWGGIEDKGSLPPYNEKHTFICTECEQRYDYDVISFNITAVSITEVYSLQNNEYTFEIEIKEKYP